MLRNKNEYIHKVCRNCGLKGHISVQCMRPITSYGLILININGNVKIKNNLFDPENKIDISKINIEENENFKLFSNNVEFLLIKRRNTFEYAEFIMGKYNPTNVEKIKFLLSKMTIKELDDLLKYSFDKLWYDFWNGDNNKNYDKHFEESKRKFDSLIRNDNKNILEEIIEETKSKLKCNNEEWGFPKGRKNLNENEYDCALREFYEETGINTNLIKLLNNIGPIKEEYIGTNGVRYLHIYFIGVCNDNITPLIDSSNKIQCNEVGDIGFYKLNNTLSLIRPYQLERLNIVIKLYMFMINYLEIEAE